MTEKSEADRELLAVRVRVSIRDVYGMELASTSWIDRTVRTIVPTASAPVSDADAYVRASRASTLVLVRADGGEEPIYGTEPIFVRRAILTPTLELRGDGGWFPKLSFPSATLQALEAYISSLTTVGLQLVDVINRLHAGIPPAPPDGVEDLTTEQKAAALDALREIAHGGRK